VLLLGVVIAVLGAIIASTAERTVGLVVAAIGIFLMLVAII
jgi:hypothetical protein